MTIALKPVPSVSGLPRADFRDAYEDACSIQDAEAGDPPRIMLGANDVNGVPARMHLTQDMVRELLPLLHRFVETGSIADVPRRPTTDELA